jgi:type II secretory pathway pseudopilin PulG
MVWRVTCMLLPKRSNSSSGFTLIELLVTAGLALVLIGGSLFSYTTYQNRQTQVTTAKQVISILSSARNRAASGDKPSVGCGTLDGYRARSVENTDMYFVSARCNGTNVEEESYRLAPGYIFTGAFDVIFPTLTGEVTPSEISVEISKALDPTADLYRFRILPSGVIEDEGMVAP